MKKKGFCIAVILIAIVSVTFVYAEGQNEEEKGAVSEITLWRHLDNPENGLFDALIEKFNEENAGEVFCNFEMIPWSGAHDKYVTSLVAGTGADVIFYSAPNWGSEFWDMGVLEPLNDYVDAWDGKDQIDEVLWQNSTIDGQIFGFPILTIPTYLYYRADWFEQLGLEPPKTREDMLVCAKAITDGIDGAYGFDMRGARGGNSMWLSFVLSAVDNKWFDENGISTLRSEEAKAANRWYVELFTKHHVTPSTAPIDGFSEIMSNFKAGFAGIMLHHLMSSTTLAEAVGEENLGVTIVPSVNGNRATDIGLHQYVINTNSEEKDASWDFITWMAKPENQAYEGHSLGMIPVVNGVEKVDPYFSENAFVKTSLDSLSFGVMPPYVETVGEFTELGWPNNFQLALLGKITPDEMMDNLADLLEGK